MKSSGSESDLANYFVSIKKQTIGKSLDLTDGVSDISITDSDKQKKVRKNEKVNIKAKNNGKNKVKKEEKAKVKNKVKKKKEGKKKLLVDISNDKKDPLIDTPPVEQVSTRPNIPKLDFKKLDKDLGIKSHKNISDEESSSFGKDGKRFFKKKLQHESQSIKAVEVESNENDEVDSLELSTMRDLSSTRKSTLRNINSPQSKKKVTIVEGYGLDANKYSSIESEKSMTESFSENFNTNGKRSNFMGMNILSLDDLNDDPVDSDANQIPTGRTDIVSSRKERIYSIEDIMEPEVSEIKEMEKIDSVKEEIESVKEEIESLSEIKTVPSITPRKKLTNRSMTREDTSAISVPATERSGRSTSGRLSDVKEYSMTFDSGSSATEKTKSESSSEKVKTPKKVKPIEPKKQKKEKKIVKEKKYTTRKDSEPEPIKYNWNPFTDGVPYVPPRLGMKSVDPTPIAQYVVSPEALESVTAYSPYMLLITNTLKMQIDMTKNFIETQQKLYDSVINAIRPNYEYCTLENTKEFIKRNRPHRLTSQKAISISDESYN